MFLDYETLRIIWWLLLGVLLTGFAIMDGFDLGVGILLPFVARKDIERRVVVNTVGPVWEGNQVWIILGAGAIFAAWPYIYAIVFSGFYMAMFILLTGFILRPVGFKYRSKVSNPRWRETWDWMLFLGGLIPALIFGVALGNILQGIPYHFDDSMREFYTGSFLGLLNPFALLCGLTSIAMLVMHGGAYLTVKTEGEVHYRALRYSRWATVALICFFAAAGVWVAYGLMGYALVHPVLHDGPSTPFHKEVIQEVGAWLTNFRNYPILMVVPGLGFVGAIGSLIFSGRGSGKFAFLLSSLSIIGVVATVGVSMFPFILPSSTFPNMSMIVWNASSSHITLFIMFLVAAVFVPIILLYTSWVYRVMRGKVTEQQILDDQKVMY